ncbi:MAG: FAD-binding domain-containing protein [Wenzhouxiangella sp.]|nr:FAD-binding domain-containing protein [Wenzhouxiangella sp.]
MTFHAHSLSLFPPTREAALERLHEFVPQAGRVYAAERNADPGPGRKTNVSMLSPYLRYRVLTEREVIAAVLQEHSAPQAEKFVQEVFWRTYWKGWLQMRPSVWADFVRERDDDRERCRENNGLSRALAEALNGQTGIECFDDWVEELVTTGYLHNHARMWFASIWIFTLRLPWTLGADFFLRHLLDADPASNTLGWRWVAGIQTRGKTYLARCDNIEKYTNGRYRPKGLAEQAEPIRDEAPPAKQALPEIQEYSGERNALLLIHGDDFSAHELISREWNIKAVVIAAAGHPQHPWPFGGKAEDFVQAAAGDVADRVQEALGCQAQVIGSIDSSLLIEQASKANIRCVVTTEPPVGPLSDGVHALEADLASQGIDLVRVRRGWDHRAWPHATKGFFPFKKKIPELLEQAGLSTS